MKNATKKKTKTDPGSNPGRSTINFRLIFGPFESNKANVRKFEQMAENGAQIYW